MNIKKICCIKCNKYSEFKNVIIYIFHKTLFLSVIFDKCSREDEKIFKEKESIVILQVPGLIREILTYYKIISNNEITLCQL